MKSMYVKLTICLTLIFSSPILMGDFPYTVLPVAEYDFEPEAADREWSGDPQRTKLTNGLVPGPGENWWAGHTVGWAMPDGTGPTVAFELEDVESVDAIRLWTQGGEYSFLHVDVYAGDDDPNDLDWVGTFDSTVRNLDVNTATSQTHVVEAEGKFFELAFVNTLVFTNNWVMLNEVEFVVYEPNAILIQQQPEDETLLYDENIEQDVELSVIAWGKSKPLSYQWKLDGVEIEGATGPTLLLTDVKPGDAKSYSCVITSPGNSVGVETDIAIVQVFEPRLLAHWPLDGDIQSVIEGSPETFVYGDEPDVVSGVPGLYDTALRGLGDTALYTSMDDAEYWDSMNYSLTVSMWMKSDTVDSWETFVSRCGRTGYGWAFRNFSGLPEVHFVMRGTTGNDDQPTIGGNPYDGQWNHFAATWDGAQKRLYMNGELRASQGDIGTIYPTAASVALFGRFTDEGDLGLFSNAALSDVKLYNYARTAEQIAQEYLSVTGGEWVCDSGLPALQFDLTGDCRVGLEDFALLATEWLEDNRIYAAP